MSETNVTKLCKTADPDLAPSSPRRRALSVAEFTARGKAFRFPKGQSGNLSGQSRLYHECRKLAREASPEMMTGLIDLAKNAVDERVRAVCLIAVLDRAGVRGYDFDPNSEKDERPKFNPCDNSPAELDLIEAAFRLMVTREAERKPAAT